MKTNFLYGIVASSKTRVRCIFCGVFVPKASKCIEQHTNGIRHTENIEYMNENGISLNGDEVFCKVCNSALQEDESVLQHIESDSHGNWMAAMEDLVDGEFIALENYLSSEKEVNQVYCEVCKCYLTCTLSTIEDHVNNFTHRSKVAEKLKPLNGIFPTENDDEVWCKICNVFIDNTVESILNHIDDDEQHTDWFAEVEELLQEQDVSLVEYLTNEFEVHAHCNKCDTNILCTLQSLEDHVMSETHLEQFG